MNEFSKENIKERYDADMKVIYRQMLDEEETKLSEINSEWNDRKREMLTAIAKYDVATKGGKSRDLNTLNVEIITRIEKFRSCDQNPERIEKAEEVENNIKALRRLLNL